MVDTAHEGEWVEGRIKTFARQIESFLNTDPQANDQNLHEIRTSSLISCQVVSFGTESGVVNTYSVYTCCHELSEYELKLKEYFEDQNNLSIISIFKEASDDGIWVEHLNPNITTDPPESFELTFAHRKTSANYRKFNDEAECTDAWLKWSDLMGRIYPFARSVFSKNQRIVLHRKEDGGIFSGVYLTFAVKLNYKQIGIIGQISDTLLQEIAYKQLIPDLYHDLETQAARAAISQVMARNMSHNVGSHVLSKFKDRKQFIRDDGEDFAGGRYSSPPDDSESRGAGAGNQYLGVFGPRRSGTDRYDHGSLYSHEAQHYYVGENSELENYNQLAYFNEYLKNRMDLLADIATANPVMENAKYLYQEVFKGFDQNRILLNRISGISDEKFRFSIALNWKEGENVVALDKRNDIQVAMTNDILGAQAFYIILENIIRNIAKHAKPDDDERSNIVITIEIAEYKADAEYYEVQLYDNLKRPAERVAEKVKARNVAFNASILNEKDSTLRSKDLGTIEMDVCAAYMRRIPIEMVESDDYRLRFTGMEVESKDDKTRIKELEDLADKKECQHYEGEVLNDGSLEPINPERVADRGRSKYPKLMFAFRKEHNEGRHGRPEEKYSLGYKFYLRKPKEVLVVVQGRATDNPQLPFELKNESTGTLLKNKELASFGIGLITKGSLIESLKERTVYNHQLLYNATGSTLETTIEFAGTKLDFASRLPKRTVDGFSHASIALTPKQFVNKVWEKWASDRILNRFASSRPLLEFSEFGNTVGKSFSRNGDKVTSEELANEIQYFRIFRDNHAKFWCMCVERVAQGVEKAEEARDSCKERISNPNKHDSMEPWTMNYYDMECSHSWIKKHTDKLNSVDDGNRHLAEYLEVVSTKIVLIDERIQENVANPIVPRIYGGKVDLFCYFRRQNIIVPRIPSPEKLNGHEFTDPAKELLGLKNGDYVNLNVSDFQASITRRNGETHDTVKERLIEFFKLHEDADFIVIHLGILEKLVPSKAEKDKDGISHVLAKLCDSSDRLLSKVIVTSGRGEPDNVPYGVAYIPIAPIQNAVETLFDKAILVKLLNNAREI